MGCNQSSSTVVVTSNGQYRQAKESKNGFQGQKVTLHYFGMRARAEFIHILLAQAGVEYTRRDIEYAQWPKIKQEEMGGNGLPCFEVEGGIRLFQSNAIARYIAMKTGYAGKNFLEQALVDMAADTVQDIVDGAFAAIMSKDKAKLEEYIEGPLQKTLTQLNTFIENNQNQPKYKGSKFMVGDSVTWADIKLFAILNLLATAPGSGGETAFRQFKGINDLYRTIKELPNVAKFLQTRPADPAAVENQNGLTGKKLTLHYFNARARAEFIRILFAQGGVEYKNRVFSFEEWPPIKEKEMGGNGAPSLEVDGVKVFQSNAIARYVATQTGLGGFGNIEQAQVDMMADTVQDLYEHGLPAYFSQDIEKINTYFEEKLKGSLDTIQKLIQTNQKTNPKSKFLVGTTVTWADIKLYGILEFMVLTPAKSGLDQFKPWKSICDLYNEVASLPNVAKYLANRPETPF